VQQTLMKSKTNLLGMRGGGINENDGGDEFNYDF
jgi:hypothetical protein